MLERCKVFLTGISDPFRKIVIPSEEHKALLRWVDNKPFNEPYTDLSA